MRIKDLVKELLKLPQNEDIFIVDEFGRESDPIVESEKNEHWIQ